jgi:two-component system OmpR family sensor kinase
VDAVMQAHGGKVTVESELGKGAKFTLFFPIQEL